MFTFRNASINGWLSLISCIVIDSIVRNFSRFLSPKGNIPPQPVQEETMEASPPKKLAKKLGSFAHASGNPEELLRNVIELLQFADTPERQQACIQEINALLPPQQPLSLIPSPDK